MAGASDLFGQLWKEYAKSDSRYLTSEPFTLCMETVTAVCGHLLGPYASYTDVPMIGLLGTALICNGLPDHSLAPLSLPNSSHRFSRPDLRSDSILRHQHVRPLR